ncbi:protein of unknown function [Polaromonas sp. OV174]|uniref:DUF4328 domain-containing protein n=1 Tax=Polaromonas sp. OV174 TaxID=1855300 RepID=UPI0008F1E8E2|nr:DUF4328 domain-containing protein [Polaromonas sp. OV174]SFC33885.1 protein of unknown function [Polaromonas sp. OV174]
MNAEKLENAKNALFIALGIDMAVTAVVLASNFWMVGVLNDIAAGGPAASPSVVGYITFWDNFFNTIILTMFGVGWALIHWLDACYTYAKGSLKATGLLQERWKTWGWLPFINLFKPYQVLNEIYKVGAINGVEIDDWKKSSGSGALLTWWIFWVISHLVMQGIGKEIPNSLSLVDLNIHKSSIVFCFLSLLVAGTWFMVAGSLTGRLLDRSSKPARRVVSSNAANARAGNDAYVVGVQPPKNRGLVEALQQPFPLKQQRTADEPIPTERPTPTSVAAPPHTSSPDLMQKIASEIETLPSGRMGGLISLALSVMGLLVLAMLFTIAEPDLPNKIFKEIGSALWAAFFGYLSYWFYSGKADPRFGTFRIGLSMALVSGFLAANEWGKSGLGSWKTVFFIALTVVCVFGGFIFLKTNVTTRPKNQLDGLSVRQKSPIEHIATEFYEAAIGRKNNDYYLNKFRQFDQQGPGLKIDWNWAAFVGGGFWALHRKMYGWFLMWGLLATGAATLKGHFFKLNILLAIVFWIGFSIFSNSLYHAKIKARIALAKRLYKESFWVSKSLCSTGGVHTWVPIFFGGTLLIGIATSVFLPM